MAATRRAGEFELIRRHFAPLATAPGARGLLDDAALFRPPDGRELVLTTDAIVAGVHFLADDPADLVARKLLRVNLSDLAAMAARPVGYLLAAAWPRDMDEDWIAGFAAGLAEDQARFAVSLYGGDTVSTDGPLTLSLTAFGEVQAGAAVGRGGARSGDRLYVTGTIGDGALGLLAAQGRLTSSDEADRAYLAGRYRLPEPRTTLGPELASMATAMLDVSDGLVADAGHLAEVSGIGLVIEASKVPLSPAARRAVTADPGLLDLVLTGGDDYELLFTAPAKAAPRLTRLAADLKVGIAEIGHAAPGGGVGVMGDDGSAMPLQGRGWRHF